MGECVFLFVSIVVGGLGVGGLGVVIASPHYSCNSTLITSLRDHNFVTGFKKEAGIVECFWE